MADDDEFDVEKYREERPMDYLLAVQLIREQQDPIIKKLTLDNVLKIMHLHVPDVLYKYYSLNEDVELNENKLSTLRNSKIYLSDLKSLNDPFDSKGYFYRNEELMRFQELKSYDGRILDDVFVSHKIASLSKVGINNMNMWSHYSYNHAGYCVSYDMRDENQDLTFRSCTHPVQYISERLDITDLMVSQIENILNEKNKQIAMGRKTILIDDFTLPFIIPLLNNLKGLAWKQEEEFRCNIGNWEANGGFVRANPKAIYIGLKCLPEHAKTLVEIGFELNVPVYIMSFDEKSSRHELVADKII